MNPPSDPSTGLPTGPAAFPATAWTVIRGAQDLRHADAERALGRLTSVYWRPVYWTVRREWNASPEEAMDLTQEYFSVFLEKGFVHDVAEERGRFRSYVKATLRHFMLNRRRGERTRKREGAPLAISIEDVERLEAEGVQDRETPEKLFERELMRAIVQRVLGDMDEASKKAGRERSFELFHVYYMEECAGRRPRYEDLRAKFGLGPHDVKNRLAEMRARFRKRVLDYLRDGIRSEQELESEIREVFES